MTLKTQNVKFSPCGGFSQIASHTYDNFVPCDHNKMHATDLRSQGGWFMVIFVGAYFLP